MSDTVNINRSQYATALFDSRQDAEAAIDRIVLEGVSRDEITMVAGGEADTSLSETREEKGFFASLSDFFMPEEDRHVYAEGLSRGGYLVSLNTSAETRDRVLEILDQEGTVDMGAREESWRSEGWEGYRSEPAIRSGVVDATTPTAGLSEQRIVDEGAPIEVVEEQLRVGKREVDHGRIRVRSYVVETPVEEAVSLRSETVSIERKAVDRRVEGAGDALFAERTIEAQEISEEAVVSKEARVVEEITLGKEVDQRTETITDSVRRTEVEVEDERASADQLPLAR